MASRKGWSRVAFGDVVRLVRERSANPSGDGFERYVGLEHLEPGELRIRTWGNVAEGTTFTNVFHAGQVLFGKRRAYQGKVAMADFDGVCSGDIYVLEPKDKQLLPELLPFICQSDSFFDHAVGTSAGSLSPRTNWESLAGYEFALPPLEEQRRIAVLLAGHLRAIESLRIAVSRVEVLRKAALQWYFPMLGGSGGFETLASLVAAGDVEFKTGPFGTVLSAREYRDAGWPIVNPTHMQNGEISHDGWPSVDDSTANRLDQYRVHAGDILLARKGDFTKAVLASDKHEGWLGGSDTIRLRCLSVRLVPGYLFLCIQAPGAAKMLASYSHGTVMPGLNEKVLGRLVIALRNADQQEAIVGRLQRVASARQELGAREQALARLWKVTLDRMLPGNRTPR